MFLIKIYKEKIVTDKKTKQFYTETIEDINYAFFFPENLNIKSNINPEPKKRGIYTTAVYNSQICLTGTYAKPDFSEADGLKAADLETDFGAEVFKMS